MKFVVTKFVLGFYTVNSFTDQQKWKLLNLVEYTYDMPQHESENTQISTQPNSKYLSSMSPRINFTCFASRRPFYYLASAYSLIFLMTIASIGTFSIKCSLPQNRLQTIVTIILSSVSFKWAINRSLPSVCYTTSLDLYSILSILFLCLVFSWHSIVGAFTPNLDQVDKWMLLTFSCIFILLQVIFLLKFLHGYMMVIKLEKKVKAFSEELKSS